MTSQARMEVVPIYPDDSSMIISQGTVLDKPFIAMIAIVGDQKISYVIQLQLVNAPTKKAARSLMNDKFVIPARKDGNNLKILFIDDYSEELNKAILSRVIAIIGCLSSGQKVSNPNIKRLCKVPSNTLEKFIQEKSIKMQGSEGYGLLRDQLALTVSHGMTMITLG